jgi:hypothetical protein
MGLESGPQLSVQIGANIKDLQTQMARAQGVVSNFTGGLTKIGAGMAAAFSVQAIASFGKEVIAITAEFQKFEAVLTNTLGSNSVAQRSLADIAHFAAVTPFSVAEVTESFVKLANSGFKPTMIEMRKLGDLASSTGKSFDQFVEAVLDANTGQFERLKEFGIKAEKEGDRVTFTFKGVQTQVAYTNDAIQAYMLSLGDLSGVSGAMAAISKTLGGQISNLGDSWDTFLRTLGDGNNGALGGTVSLLDRALKIATDLVKTTDQSRNENVLAQSGVVLDKYKTLGSSEQEKLKQKIYERILFLQMEIAKADRINQHANSYRNKEQLDIAETSIELIRNYNQELKKQSETQSAIVTSVEKKVKLQKEKVKKEKVKKEKVKNLPDFSKLFKGKMGKLGKPELEGGDSLDTKEDVAGLSQATKDLANARIADAEAMEMQMHVAMRLSQALQNGISDAIANRQSFAKTMLSTGSQIIQTEGRELILLAMRAAFIKKSFTGPGAFIAAGLAAGAMAGLLRRYGVNVGGGGGGEQSTVSPRFSERNADVNVNVSGEFKIANSALVAALRQGNYQTSKMGG